MEMKKCVAKQHCAAKKAGLSRKITQYLLRLRIIFMLFMIRVNNKLTSTLPELGCEPICSHLDLSNAHKIETSEHNNTTYC